MERDAHQVFDNRGKLLGVVLKTSPRTDDIIGYSGPSNVLIALAPNGTVQCVKLLSSQDTPAHIEQVAGRADFWRQAKGWSPGVANAMKVEAVSGSTLTSLAIMESIQRRLGSEALSLRFPKAVTLDEVRSLFPAAAAIEAIDDQPGWFQALDSNQATLGLVVRTSPQSENARGYQGPTETLLALDKQGRRIHAITLRSSYDNADYVQRVRDDTGFLAELSELSLAEWAELDFRQAGIEGVSGATQTSFAVADGIRRTARARMESAGRQESAVTSRARETLGCCWSFSVLWCWPFRSCAVIDGCAAHGKRS